MSDTKFEAIGSQLTVIRTFNANIDIVWRTWTEPELLDQWWAPKPWKSKTKRMAFSENGNRLYAMYGPKGQKHWGLTTYKVINKLTDFKGEDAFCDNQGVVNEDFPIALFHNHFKENLSKTTVKVITQYASEDHLQQVIQMGMKEGLSMAYENLDILINQIR